MHINRKKPTYKKELKQLYKEYKRVTSNVYNMRRYNSWRRKVFNLFRTVRNKELLTKYLEIKLNITKVHSTICGAIIGMTLSIMAGITINMILEFNINSVLEEIYKSFSRITITFCIILVVLSKVINSVFSTELEVKNY